MQDLKRVWRRFRSDSRVDTVIAVVSVVSWVVLVWLRWRAESEPSIYEEIQAS